MERDNIEHGWLGRYSRNTNKEPICHCEWCDEPIYYEEDVHNVNGWYICDECRDTRERENEEVW